MLVLSRHRGESVDIYPGQDFVEGFKSYVSAQLPLTADQVQFVETLADVLHRCPLLKVSVLIVEVRGDKARMGIDANPVLAVNRREITERSVYLQDDNAPAA